MDISHFTKAKLFAVSCVVLISACKGPEDTAPDSTAPAATTPAAPAKDPNAISQAIPAEAYKVTLTLFGEPVLAENGKSIVYQVEVKNEGSAPVYGVGSKAVNIGLMVLGDDGTAKGNGGERDFSRAPLPLIAPGQSALVAVVLPADARLDGRVVRLATVQEGVAWHENTGTIDLGPFKLAGKTFVGLPLSQ